jgi:dienelactone hydrolase
VIERSIAATTHGRYLTVPAVAAAPAGLLVGFHGYAEGAESQLERLRAIPGSDRWTLLAIQGLHRFYQRRTNEVIASWMTRQDRELAIADNLAYVESVVDVVWGDRFAPPRPTDDERRRDKPRLVFAGFSQGVAMALRAACATPRRVDGIIAVGGDVPPEIGADALARVRSALVCRGERDEWYSTDKFQHDVTRLRQSGAAVHPVNFEGGHEWSETVLEKAAAFLRDLPERT